MSTKRLQSVVLGPWSKFIRFHFPFWVQMTQRGLEYFLQILIFHAISCKRVPPQFQGRQTESEIWKFPYRPLKLTQARKELSTKFTTSQLYINFGKNSTLNIVNKLLTITKLYFKFNYILTGAKCHFILIVY